MRLMRLLFPPNPIKTPQTLFNSLRSHSLTSMAIPPPKSAMASAIVDNEAGVARRFWIKFRRESIFAMFHPFSLCLASGNLKIESFRSYIAQDAHFLKAFAHAWVSFLCSWIGGFWDCSGSGKMKWLNLNPHLVYVYNLLVLLDCIPLFTNWVVFKVQNMLVFVDLFVNLEWFLPFIKLL